MRKITAGQILTFFTLLTIAITLGILTTWLLLGPISLGDFRGVTLVAAAILAVYLYAFLVYRLFLYFLPLREGDIPQSSREEFSVQVHFLFYLFLFNSVITTHFLPIPLRRLIYLALGARLGSNTYSAGAILDPPLTTIGDNCIIGHDAVLFSHAIEGKHLSLNLIRIGHNVTVGAQAIVMSDVIIGDDAIVCAGAVVIKGTRIGAGETWGGIPAKRLKSPAPDGH